MVGMKHIASVSFGKDSLAMLLRLLEEGYPLDAAVFYNTGAEFDAIYKVRDRARKLLTESGVEFIELSPQEPFKYSMLERPVKYRNRDGYHYGYGWCGGVCRWGTTGKTRAITKLKSSLGSTIDYVGIAADEPARFEKEKSAGKVLPLVEWGMTEVDCLAFCRERGWNWIEETPYGDIDLYDILDRVSCWCCANKNLKELRNIYRYLPRYWERLRQLQCQIDRPFKGKASIFDLEKRFEKEIEMGGETK